MAVYIKEKKQVGETQWLATVSCYSYSIHQLVPKRKESCCPLTLELIDQRVFLYFGLHRLPASGRKRFRFCTISWQWRSSFLFDANGRDSRRASIMKDAGGDQREKEAEVGRFDHWRFLFTSQLGKKKLLRLLRRFADLYLRRVYQRVLTIFWLESIRRWSNRPRVTLPWHV